MWRSGVTQMESNKSSKILVSVANDDNIERLYGEPLNCVSHANTKNKSL